MIREYRLQYEIGGRKVITTVMTEDEWLSPEGAIRKLELVWESGRVSPRKVRLAAAAFCRAHWSPMTDARSRQVVEFAELYADGLVGPGEAHSELAADLARAAIARPDWTSPRELLVNYCWDAASIHECHVLRDVFGPVLFRPLELDPRLRGWNVGALVALAQSVYEDRQLPSGALDNPGLAVLADGLEEAGCTDAELLEHLRSPGPHVRGCWAVDLVLGRQ